MFEMFEMFQCFDVSMFQWKDAMPRVSFIKITRFQSQKAMPRVSIARFQGFLYKRDASRLFYPLNRKHKSIFPLLELFIFPK